MTPAPAATTPAPAAVGNPADAGSEREVNLTAHLGPYSVRPFGFVRMGYEYVAKDSRYKFVGRNNGFVLESARLGLEVKRGDELTAVVSVDGASGYPTGINTPQGTLDVNLRDAYARWDFSSYVGVQAGQFFAPFAAEELRHTTRLLFASRALGQEGVRPGRGIETPSLAVDRQVGVMFSPAKPWEVGPVGLSAYVMAANGNGPNQLLNDDNTPAVYARVEVSYKDMLTVGGAFLRNGRTAGTPPDLLEETDMGFAGDIQFNWNNLEAMVQFVQVGTTYDTSEAADRTQRALSAQVGYRLKLGTTVWLTPAYRFAQLDPWASGDEAAGGTPLSAFKLDYHTIGLRAEHPRLPLELHADYTITAERDPYKIDNNRLQLLMQAEF